MIAAGSPPTLFMMRRWLFATAKIFSGMALLEVDIIISIYYYIIIMILSMCFLLCVFISYITIRIGTKYEPNVLEFYIYINITY